LAVAASSALAVALAGQPVSPPAAVELKFGIYTSERATEMYRSFAPVIADLKNRATAHYGKPVTIDLQIYKTYEECFDAFLAGHVDFARIGPASYVLARERCPQIQLLALEEDEGKKHVLGVIFVRRDSKIRSVAQLRGRTFAFGDEMSTIGRYLAQAELVKAGVHAKDLKAFRYLGRHDKVVRAVQLGDFDAGSAHIATYEKLNDNQLRILQSFENVGKPWVARAGLDPKLREALSKAVLDLKQPATLAVLKVTGFQKTTDEDFEQVIEGMRDAQQFELRPVRTPSAEPPSAEPPDKR
jgi:phosphonate transport system substrate-binding protein